MKAVGRILASGALLVVATTLPGSTAARDELFNNPLFRRCIAWMLDGEQGALIGNLCNADFAIPPPSLFLCARKVLTGFESAVDQEGCAIVFEDQAKKARGGYVK